MFCCIWELTMQPYVWSFRWLLWLMLAGELVLYFTWILSFWAIFRVLLCAWMLIVHGANHWIISLAIQHLCGALELKPNRFFNLLMIMIRSHYWGMLSSVAFIWPQRDMLYIWWPVFCRNHMKYFLVLFLVSFNV